MVYRYKYKSDIALCEADSIEAAILKFKKMFEVVSEKNIKEISFNKYGVYVVTEY